MPEWLTIKKAAFRNRSSDERMRQMAGTKAETLLHTHCAPSVAHSDIRQARKLASIICTSEAAIDAYVKFSSEEP